MTADATATVTCPCCGASIVIRLEAANPGMTSGATGDNANTLTRFLAECVAIAPPESGQRALVSKVREAYESWCRGNGIEPVSSTRFGLDVKRAGIVQQRSSGRRYYVGLTIRAQTGHPGHG